MCFDIELIFLEAIWKHCMITRYLNFDNERWRVIRILSCEDGFSKKKTRKSRTMVSFTVAGKEQTGRPPKSRVKVRGAYGP